MLHPNAIEYSSRNQRKANTDNFRRTGINGSTASNPGCSTEQRYRHFGLILTSLHRDSAIIGQRPPLRFATRRWPVGPQSLPNEAHSTRLDRGPVRREREREKGRSSRPPIIKTGDLHPLPAPSRNHHRLQSHVVHSISASHGPRVCLGNEPLIGNCVESRPAESHCRYNADASDGSVVALA